MGARCGSSAATVQTFASRHEALRAGAAVRSHRIAGVAYSGIIGACALCNARPGRPPRLRRYYSSSASTPPPPPPPLPGDDDSKASAKGQGQSSPRAGARDGNGSNGKGRGDSIGSSQSGIVQKMLESAATSFASIAMLALGFGLAGYGYHRYYKHLVLRKMILAFEPGDPVLELAAMGRGVPKHITGSAGGVLSHHHKHPDIGSIEGDDENADRDDGRGNYWIERPEQKKVNDIVAGREIGHYHLFIGEKGTGKSSMQLEAMAQIDAEGVAMFDAHADLEIFRIRLGKALNYEFNEDYIGGYFSERGPRETTALLDIERALNKLEKVALRRRNATGPSQRRRPLIMIVNQMHLIRDDDDGRDLIELLQQRAEQWAASGLVTMVFNSDDYWVYERFKQLAARLEVHSIQDLARHQAVATLQRFRWRYFGEQVSRETASAIYDHVGGRLTFLNRVARSTDMLATCGRIMEAEKTWFLNQCWVLGADMDDDVMDQQKWAASAMVLAQALVDKEAKERQREEEAMEETGSGTSVGVTSTSTTSTTSTVATTTAERTQLPSFALHEAQQIMTRADFIREMDRRNLFTIASDAQVRASSVPMHEALRQICNAPGFRDHLDATVQRIADIESLGRTRELVAKDLVLGGHYEIAAPSGREGSSSRNNSNKTEVRFRGWSPHERPPRDPPEPENKNEPS